MSNMPKPLMILLAAVAVVVVVAIGTVLLMSWHASQRDLEQPPAVQKTTPGDVAPDEPQMPDQPLPPNPGSRRSPPGDRTPPPQLPDTPDERTEPAPQEPRQQIELDEEDQALLERLDTAKVLDEAPTMPAMRSVSQLNLTAEQAQQIEEYNLAFIQKLGRTLEPQNEDLRQALTDLREAERSGTNLQIDNAERYYNVRLKQIESLREAVNQSYRDTVKQFLTPEQIETYDAIVEAVQEKEQP